MKTLKPKKWIFITICLILAFLILGMGTVVYVDPFFVYHKPNQKLYYKYDDALYQCPGMVKNFDYEMLIAGTSLIQNMKTSTAKSVFGLDAIKTPLCGISLERNISLMNLAIESNPELKTIIFPIYANHFCSESDEDNTNFPDHLYDNNILNDISYLLNKDIIFNRNLDTILNPHNRIQDSPDSIFSSETTFFFAEYVVMERKNASWDWNTTHSLNCVKHNKELLCKFIDENPQIKFEFFITPKNILYLNEAQKNNMLNFELDILKEISTSLLKYENVDLHFFQDDVEIIGNLYNYCDFIHFSSHVSDKILFDIKNKTKIVTPDSLDEQIQNVKTITKKFDYSVFSTSHPLKSTNDINKYLNLISDDKYEVFVSYLNSDNKAFSIGKNTENLFNTLGIDIETVISSQEGQSNQKWSENSTTQVLFSDNGSIFINDINYSMELPGLNIVIYDKALDRIIDSVNFSGDHLSECLRTKNTRK